MEFKILPKNREFEIPCSTLTLSFLRLHAWNPSNTMTLALLSGGGSKCILTFSRIVVHALALLFRIPTLSCTVVQPLALSHDGLHSHSHDAFTHS